MNSLTYKWDFSSIFKSKVDWELTLSTVQNHVEELLTLKGKLYQNSLFARYLKLNEMLQLKLTKLRHYLFYLDLDHTNLLFQNLQNIFQEKEILINEQLSWIEPELKSIGKKKIFLFLTENVELAKYQYFFENFFKNAKYLLANKLENQLSKVEGSRTDIYDLYDSLAYADRKLTYLVYKNKRETLTLPLYQHILENSSPAEDQLLRNKVAKLYTSQFADHKHSFAKIYSSIVKLNLEEVKIRKFKHFLNYYLDKDDVSQKMYFQLLASGKRVVPFYKKYIKLKQVFLKLKKIYLSDNQLILFPEIEPKWEIEDAIKIIKKVFSQFGEAYTQALEQALSDGKIDYFSSLNKREGAYSIGGEGVSPFILMNWDYKLDSVFTLIHELGHSIHTIFADKKQPWPLSNYPIIQAEVASTIHELMLIHFLKTEFKDKKFRTINLLQRTLDMLFGTFLRQIQFSNFEFEVHDRLFKGNVVNSDTLSNLFFQLSSEYGSNVFDTFKAEKNNFGWPRVSHFFHSPFYVHKYPLALTVAFDFFSTFLKDLNPEPIINFMEDGGSQRPSTIFNKYGIKLANKEIYFSLEKFIESLVEEFQNNLETC